MYQSIKNFSKTLEDRMFSPSRQTVYGPLPSKEMRFASAKEEADEFKKNVYEFCDKLFKFFSWCLAIGVASLLWQNTRFGLFLIIVLVMIVALVAYIITLSIYPAYFVARKLGSKGINTMIITAITLIIIMIGGVFIPRVFAAGLSRLVRAQACSIYHKNSPNVPPECRKFVRL